jgi:hypothetical protein
MLRPSPTGCNTTDMGFRKPMDYNAVHHQICISGVELCSPRNDGFTTWEIKKDLYRLKFLLDEILADSPTYSGEHQFLEEHAKKKMWKTLNEV